MIFLGSHLKKAILALGIACALSGCNTAEPSIASGGMEEMGVRAEAVEDGIRLSFSNIPPETTRMFIHISDRGGKEEISGSNEILSKFADIRGNALEKLKVSGKVICPFVQSGRVYEIAVCYEKSDEREDEEWVFAECTARNGTYFADGLELKLNENLTAVTLSAEPEFSGEVLYAPAKYRCGVTIKKEDYWSIGVGDTSASGNFAEESLTWRFQPLVNDDIAASGYLESGEYSAYATFYCNAIYGDLTWAVELAKSGIFTVRF